MAKNVRLRLVIDIEYKPNGEYVNDLRERLDNIPGWLASEGQFTGDSAAEVKTWTHKVERIVS